MATVVLTEDEARLRLLGWLGLAHDAERICSPTGPESAGGMGVAPGQEAVRALLGRLRHIQLDPLDVIGTNADLVAMARLPGLARGDVYRHLGPDAAGQSGSFEHFAKVRCLLPPSFFPYYREHMPTVSWWKDGREERLGEGVLDAVLDEVRDRGPIAASALADHGRVEQLDWSGWKSTAKAATMALEVLWARCAVVVSGKDARGHRLYDVPERALPDWAHAAAGPWGRWAVGHRAAAAGLLPATMGPWWTTLRGQRTDGTVDRMVADGELVEVRVSGSGARYLCLAELLDRPAPGPDDRMRILGPLDPLIWDRKLVRHLFGFEYVWEVYKPSSQRRWGWYVVPLLHRGQLAGRLEARVRGETLQVSNLWWEPGAERGDALDQALEGHATACGARAVEFSGSERT
jgi:uncharacterized protein YcaQ